MLVFNTFLNFIFETIISSLTIVIIYSICYFLSCRPIQWQNENWKGCISLKGVDESLSYSSLFSLMNNIQYFLFVCLFNYCPLCVFQFQQFPQYNKSNTSRNSRLEGFTLVLRISWEAIKPGVDLRSLHLCTKVLHQTCFSFTSSHLMPECIFCPVVRCRIYYILICGASSQPILTLCMGNNSSELSIYKPSNRLQWLINFSSKAQARGDVVRKMEDYWRHNSTSVLK